MPCKGFKQLSVIIIIQVAGCDKEDDIVIALSKRALGDRLLQVTVLQPPRFSPVLRGAGGCQKEDDESDLQFPAQKRR